ncbi:hypothetical protein H0H92_000990 [Tricholoma furcatifolium]|nr:hypothetical protein H0H92_000990 [Tricholoma furcatifolium]
MPRVVVTLPVYSSLRTLRPTLRIWDTMNLKNIVEVLRPPMVKLDIGEADGLDFNTGDFIVYWLSTHRVITRIQVGHAELPPPARGGGEWKPDALGLKGARIESFEASRDVS